MVSAHCNKGTILDVVVFDSFVAEIDTENEADLQVDLVIYSRGEKQVGIREDSIDNVILVLVGVNVIMVHVDEESDF